MQETGDAGLIPGLRRSPGEGNGNPFQYMCLENLMDIGAWWATVYGVTKTQLSDWVYMQKTFRMAHIVMGLLWTMAFTWSTLLKNIPYQWDLSYKHCQWELDKKCKTHHKELSVEVQHICCSPFLLQAMFLKRYLEL